MSTNLPAELQTAIAERGVDPAVWRTLQNSVFPGAKDESILLAIDYCKARKMDILKKPCHIVPMSVKDAKTGNSSWRDVIMPGIYEQRITAFRTGQMAGQDEPQFGESITHLGVNAPEWCKVTVYRFINGERCAFSHTEYFSEACSTTKDGKINQMWTKRPRGQLAKCAEAGALRKAFPDELGGVMTADEITEDTTATQVQPTEMANNTVIHAKAETLASDEQVGKIHKLLELTGKQADPMLAFFGKQTIEQLDVKQAEGVIRRLSKELDEMSAETVVETAEPQPQGEDVEL